MGSDVESSNATLAVLAGGEGRRMGIPKSQLRLGGRPVLAYLLDRLAWPGPTLLVTAPALEHPPGCERFQHEATDPVAGDGPLRGVLTALQNATTPTVAIVTVDMPCVSRDQLQWLLHQLESRPDCPGLMLTRIKDGHRLIEPFPLVCRVRAMSLIESHLAARRRAVHSLLDQAEFADQPAPDSWPASTWTNLNRPDELADFCRQVE